MKKFEILSWGMENDRYIKIISIIGFTSILLSLIIIAKTPPASGYEISIYEVYPFYMWVILTIPFARLKQLAEAGRRFVEENFTSERAVENWTNILKGIDRLCLTSIQTI